MYDSHKPPHVSLWPAPSQEAQTARRASLHRWCGFGAIGRGALVSSSAAVFERILEPGITACVWNRKRDDIIRRYWEAPLWPDEWRWEAQVNVGAPRIE